MYIMDTRRIREFMSREVEDFLRYNTWLTDCILVPLTDGVAFEDVLWMLIPHSPGTAATQHNL